MAEDKLAPISITERIEIVDVLCGLAIGGIFVGNMQWFSGYGFMPDAIAAQSPFADQAARFLVHVFIEGKFYSIFSFLFGFGFALQISRAADRGDTQATVFKRRLFWLLIIGVIHAFLLWSGDILSVYALMGFVLLLFRKKATESLPKWIFGLIIAPIAVYVIFLVLFLVFAPPDVAASVADAKNGMWQNAVSVVPNGTYLRIMVDYNLNILAGRWAGLIFEMRLPKILAMFLLGFYAYRRGIFQSLGENKALISRVLVYGLPVGIVLNLIFAYYAGRESVLPPEPIGLLGVVTYGFGVPALALGIIALTVTAWQCNWGQKILSIFVPVGRMAMTNYLLQTVVAITIFYGFGFGLYGTTGAAKATAIALTVFVFQIILCTVWLKFFQYGPMEWIWRQLTYRKRLPLLRSS